MNGFRYSQTDERILVLGSYEINLKAIQEIVTQAGFTVEYFLNMEKFCGELLRGAGACIITQDALGPESIIHIQKALQIQPSWSNIGIILTISESTNPELILNDFGASYNITITSTPLHPINLTTTVRSLLQARIRQYQYRELLHSLENKNKELETIIGIVSHDLRAPLVNIKGFGNELAKDVHSLDTLLTHISIQPDDKKRLDIILHEELPESLRFIQTSADAIDKLIVTLVEVARAGYAPVRPEKLDMNEVVQMIIASIAIKFKEANIRYDINELPDCYADKVQVEQIFRNLIDNAVKYLAPERSGQICISGKLQAGSSLYCVADNGIGIGVENQEKIFDPFYQLKEKASGGMGLGLSTVKRMVDRNNGKIWVISEKGKGSMFYVALPSATSSGTES